MFSDEIVVFDNISGTLFMINYVDPSIPNAYELGIENLRAIISKKITIGTITLLLHLKNQIRTMKLCPKFFQNLEKMNFKVCCIKS